MTKDILTYNEEYSYVSPDRKIGLLSRCFPSFCYYLRFMKIIYKASRVAKKGQYSSDVWAADSLSLLRALESVGVKFEISGVNNLRLADDSVVVIGNHMSMLETMVLPAIVQPQIDTTFIVKQALLDYPVFKYIMRSRDPIALTRNNPRKDFKIVMGEGVAKLKDKMSVIVFPQTTRTNTFDPSAFSTIGVKLAKKADKKIVPLALITDAWGNGKILKDFGKINPDKKVVFRFGKPISADNSSQDEIVSFIAKEIGHK